MKTFSVSGRLIAILLVAGTLSASPQSRAGAQTAADAVPAPAYAPVSTVAGSGDVSLADGSAAAAGFVLPIDVAEDPAGAIFIADFAGQRIRRVARDGTVSTVAGGGVLAPTGLLVPPDHADGPAASARFNYPAGVAVDAHDTIYVAESGQHDIRKIENGVVSTYAGNGDVAGDKLGPARGGALFQHPVALALDSDGDLYVADESNGIREVTTSGNVVVPEIAAGIVHPSAISIFDIRGVRAFAIADSLGIMYVSPAGDHVRLPIITPAISSVTHGKITLGYPLGVTMIGLHDIVFSDPRTNTIRLWSAGETRAIAGEAVADPEHRGGGFRDGPGELARFSGPAGLVRDIDGGVIVADSSNRRIRKLGIFDRRNAVDPAFGELPVLRPNARHVLLIGNSFVCWDVDWRNSIAGAMENELEKDGKGPVQVIAVRSPGLTVQEQQAYIEQVIADMPIDYAVFLVNSLTAVASYPPSARVKDDWWVEPVARDLQRNASALPHPANVVVAINPYPWEMTPAGALYHRYFEKMDQEWITANGIYHTALRKMLALSGLQFVDLFESLASEDRASTREPLFATNEEHFSDAGNRLVGFAIAHFIAADAHWRTVAGRPQ